MQQENKNLCKQFENEVWLYISDEIDSERKALWDKHLAECPECTGLLNSDRRIASLYKENMSEDLLDSSFDKIIEKATSKISFFEKVKYSFSGFGKSFVFGKIVFGSMLVTVSLIVMLVSQRPNPVKQISADIARWDDKETVSKITEISRAISTLEGGSKHSEAEWKRSIEEIENQIDSLKICINN